MTIKAYIHFCHDLEDGWYVLTKPSGEKSNWDSAKSVDILCKQNGWDLRWIGGYEFYRPPFISMDGD